MKLSINGPALDRLLGGDTELELELRHQVVNQFVKHRLDAVLKSEPYLETMKAIRAAMVEAVKEEVGTLAQRGGWATMTEKHNLKMQIKELLDATIRLAVEECLKKALDDKIDYYSKSWAGYIDKRVAEVFNRNIEKRVADEVVRRLDAARAMGESE